MSDIETCLALLSFNDNDLVRGARAELAVLRGERKRGQMDYLDVLVTLACEARDKGSLTPSDDDRVWHSTRYDAFMEAMNKAQDKIDKLRSPRDQREDGGA